MRARRRGWASTTCASRDAFAGHEALLRWHAVAFNLANVGRAGMQQTTEWGWTIRSFRAHLLKTLARVLLHARRAVAAINDIAAYYWPGLARFGCDPSTISRTIDEKYIQTPRGIYPLRMFFTGGAETGDGEAPLRPRQSCPRRLPCRLYLGERRR